MYERLKNRTGAIAEKYVDLIERRLDMALADEVDSQNAMEQIEGGIRMLGYLINTIERVGRSPGGDKRPQELTYFEKLTKNPDTLSAFLKSLPCLDGPWDLEFQKRYCTECAGESCDACPNERFRNNPGWWLNLETPNDQEATTAGKEPTQ